MLILFFLGGGGGRGGSLAKNFFSSSIFSSSLCCEDVRGSKGGGASIKYERESGWGFANLDIFLFLLTIKRKWYLKFLPIETRFGGAGLGSGKGPGHSEVALMEASWSRWEGEKGEGSKGVGGTVLLCFLHSLEKIYCGFKKKKNRAELI